MRHILGVEVKQGILGICVFVSFLGIDSQPFHSEILAQLSGRSLSVVTTAHGIEMQKSGLSAGVIITVVQQGNRTVLLFSGMAEDNKTPVRTCMNGEEHEILLEDVNSPRPFADTVVRRLLFLPSSVPKFINSVGIRQLLEEERVEHMAAVAILLLHLFKPQLFDAKLNYAVVQKLVVFECEEIA